VTLSNNRKGLLGLLLALLVINGTAHFSYAAPLATGACHAVFLKEPMQIPEWNLKSTAALELPIAEIFLPEKFKNEIERELGPIKEQFAFYDSTAQIRRKAKTPPSQHLFHVVNEYKGKGFELSFSLKEKADPFIEIIGLFDKEDPTKIHLTSLSLSNPLSKKTNALHQSQETKGLPYPVFKFMKERLFYFLKQGGVRTIEVEAAEDYTVSVLYRRFVGLKPANELSQIYFELFDWLYKSAKYISPEIEYKNIDEFSRLLGSAEPAPPSFYAAEAQWKNVLSGIEPVPTNFSIYKYEDKTYAFAIRDGENKGLYFVHPEQPAYVFHWSNTIEQLHLKMNIPD
jgi:hypothetical protein